MSNDAKATSTRRPGRPKAGSEDKKARILSEALTLFSTQGYVQVRGAHDVIDESGREGESLRIGKDTRQEFGRLGGRLMGRLVGPAAGPNNRPLPQGP